MSRNTRAPVPLEVTYRRTAGSIAPQIWGIRHRPDLSVSLRLQPVKGVRGAVCREHGTTRRSTGETTRRAVVKAYLTHAWRSSFSRVCD